MTAGAAETFVLVQCGTEPPALDGELAGAAVVEIPVETMFSESTSHYGFIDVLDLEERGDRRRRHRPRGDAELAERVDAGEIESFTPSFIVDPELVVAADPDVYVTGGCDDPAHEVIAAAGIPVVPTSSGWRRRPKGGRNGSGCSPP